MEKNDYFYTIQKKTNKIMNLKTIYTSNNKTLKMLIELLNKWKDKSYDLTDTEWSTIKSYKTLLDTYFNDVTLIQKTIDANVLTISKLK